MGSWQRLNGVSGTWLDLQPVTADDIPQLIHEVPALLPVDVDDIVKIGQRPHLERRADYLFLVLLFPVYNRATRSIEPAEVDFLVTDKLVITAHDGRLPALMHALAAAKHQTPDGRELLSLKPLELLTTLLERLLAACNPMLDHISLDLRSIDDAIFQSPNRKAVREILITRRNITDFRRIMQAHKSTLKKLADDVAERGNGLGQTLEISVNALITRTKDIWDHLESFKESIVDLHATNESLLSNRLNEIMRNYTTMSVVIFSMTLVATLFSVNAGGTPIIGRSFGFWFLAALLVVLALGMLEYFRKRKWL